MDYVVRKATPADAPLLPAVETSAGRLFLSIPELSWIATDTVMSVEEHLRYIGNSTTWVAVAHSRPIGFLAAELIDMELHILELAVDSDCQGRGVGRALMRAAIETTREKGLDALTLTTFLGVPCNAPFYRSLGFQILEDLREESRLRTILEEEVKKGSPGKIDVPCDFAWNAGKPVANWKFLEKKIESWA